MIAMVFVLLTQSDARMPRKPHHPSTGKPQLLHHRHKKLHAAATTRSPYPEQVVAFSKRMYSELGGKAQGNITLVSEEFQSEFDQINNSTHGDMGRSLISLFEIRMLDLQQSIHHARRMRDAVQRLVGGEEAWACVLCDSKTSV